MFQKTVFTIAIIILILTLCVIGINLRRQKYNSVYPPVIPNCTDYWDMKDNMCVNSMNLGKATCREPMDFSKAQWSGNSGLCSKYTWAKTCNLSWDGITSNPDVCN